MAAVTLQLLTAAFVDFITWLLGFVATILLLIWRVNPIWVILVAGGIGVLLHR